VLPNVYFKFYLLTELGQIMYRILKCPFSVFNLRFSGEVVFKSAFMEIFLVSGWWSNRPHGLKI